MKKNNSISNENIIDDISVDEVMSETKSNKDSKIENPKICKVTFWNKYTKIIGFDYDGVGVQMTLDKDIDSNSVKVLLKDKKYEIL